VIHFGTRSSTVAAQSTTVLPIEIVAEPSAAGIVPGWMLMGRACSIVRSNERRIGST
jgi:hypothetical protein